MSARRRFAWLVRVVTVFTVLVAFSTLVWAEEPKLSPVADSSWPLKGPDQAKGVVLWSHGTTTWGYYIADATKTSIPLVMGVFLANGYDLYRLDRPALIENYRTSTAFLVDAIKTLRQKGYHRVVLAGQSFGAWISVIAAGEVPVDAVIAFAPAAYGLDQDRYRMNGYVLMDYLGDVLPQTKVAVAFFDGDPFDPGGRGPKAETVLSEHHLAHLVIDRPAGIKGHGGGYSVEFTKAYGRCLVTFVEAGERCP